MADHTFHTDEAALLKEIKHVKEIMWSMQRNLAILEQIIARQGVANVDLYFRKAALEDDLATLENRKRDLEASVSAVSNKQTLQVSSQVLYTHLPSGVLNLYNPDDMPLVKYEIFNNVQASTTFVLTSEIMGFSFTRSDTINVAATSQKICSQLPRIEVEHAKKLTEIRLATLRTRITYLKDGTEQLLRQQDFEIYLMARNMIRWAVPCLGEEQAAFKPLLEHIAAWVTPHVESVKQMLRAAVHYLPEQSIWGYQGKPDPLNIRVQVKAIYQALKEVGLLAYVNSPFVIGPNSGEVRQAVRLPGESLNERSANCIDGAVLYASLLELAALEPIIVIQTGHAFVGWKTWQRSNRYEFLETTMTFTATFEDAFKKGMEEYHQVRARKWFDHEVFDHKGFARLLDIKALHDTGIYPME